jgi:hypothetical protein
VWGNATSTFFALYVAANWPFRQARDADRQITSMAYNKSSYFEE